MLFWYYLNSYNARNRRLHMQVNPLPDIFKTTGALLEGHFKLTSGRHSPQYFQCAKVLQHPDHLQLICGIIVYHFRRYEIDTVISPAIGGIVVGSEVGRQMGKKSIFTERKEGVMSLRRGFTVKPGEKFLVIEDVITTGGSVKEVIDLIEAAGGIVIGVGSVVDRSNGKVQLSDNQFSALVLEVVSYAPDECPLCMAGIPIEKPGSRPGE